QLDQGVPAVAAIGAATAAVLGDHRCRLVPETQSAVGLLAELPPPAAHGAEVLVVHAVDASSTLVDGLDAAGWTVTSIAPYRSVAARLDARAQLAALRADAVLFASGSAARGWVAQFGTTTPAIVVAMGPQTAADATQLGLKIDVVAADHSLVGMVAALQRTFGESN
ncbi:MAG: uroporphyrinogen-III synthase, partial [Ilumatobacteraceae bacterium]